MSNVIEKLLEVLENDPRNDIAQCRLEAAYFQTFGIDLINDLIASKSSIKSIFENGLQSNHCVYKLINLQNGTYLVEKTFLKETLDYAKASEIYTICNQLLDDPNQMKEIPIDYVEELVSDILQSQRKQLSYQHKGINFEGLIQRACNILIHGFYLEGKLCKQLHSYDSTSHLRSHQEHLNKEPLSPFCQFPTENKIPIEIFDSDEEGPTCSNTSIYASRFSGPRMNQPNWTNSTTSISSKLSNITIRPLRYTDSQDFSHMAHDRYNSILNVLIERHATASSNFIACDSPEEVYIQREIVMRCKDRWGSEIVNISQFLYILKLFWLKSSVFNIFDVREKMFDSIVESLGSESPMNWRLFYIFYDDLIPLDLFTTLNFRNEKTDKGQEIEVNFLIQAANFYIIDEKTCAYRLYKFLNEQKDNSASFDKLEYYENVSIQHIIEEINDFLGENHIFIIEKDIIRLNTPFPFFIVEKNFDYSNSVHL